MKARIVEVTRPNGDKVYVIQQKHWLFRWSWVPASWNTYEWVTDTFSTEKEAKKNLCWFDGTKNKYKVITQCE